MEECLHNLLIRASRGDSDAFDMLFLKYQPKMLKFITSIIKDEELSKDICQDIFFRIWKGKESLLEVRSFDHYLYVYAKNAIYNYFDRLQVNFKYENYLKHLPLETYSEEDKLFVEELQEKVDEIVSRLPERMKIVYNMSRVDGMTNDEIAKKLNISKRTVENNISLALSKLRKTVKIILFLFGI